MELIARSGDAIGHGNTPTGTIIEGSSTLFVEGEPAARVGDKTTCSWSGHAPNTPVLSTIISGSTKVFNEGSGIARVNDPVGCGATILTGSSKSFAN